MSKLTPISLKKSTSLYTKKQIYRPSKSVQLTYTNRDRSLVEQLIFQKYNFNARMITDPNDDWLKRHSIDKTSNTPVTNVILISQFPKIQSIKSIDSKVTLFHNQKIKTKQKQSSFLNCDYSFIDPQKRKFTDYKNCIKKIQMNTTYRGFNFHKDKINKNFHILDQDSSNLKNQENNKTPFNTAQRKRIIHHIIQRGFAKKMEESLLKARNEKKKMHDQILSIKNTKDLSQIKPKRSVVFTNSSPLEIELIPLPKGRGKQQPIEPW